MRNPALAFFGGMGFLTSTLMLFYGIVTLNAIGVFSGGFFAFLSMIALGASGIFSVGEP